MHQDQDQLLIDSPPAQRRFQERRHPLHRRSSVPLHAKESLHHHVGPIIIIVDADAAVTAAQPSVLGQEDSADTGSAAILAAGVSVLPGPEGIRGELRKGVEGTPSVALAREVEGVAVAEVAPPAVQTAGLAHPLQAEG